MESDKDCDSAISGLDGIEIEGHKLTVEKAKGKEHGHGPRGSKESKSGIVMGNICLEHFVLCGLLNSLDCLTLL